MRHLRSGVLRHAAHPLVLAIAVLAFTVGWVCRPEPHTKISALEGQVGALNHQVAASRSAVDVARQAEQAAAARAASAEGRVAALEAAADAAKSAAAKAALEAKPAPVTWHLLRPHPVKKSLR